jgi:hypothetical protein
VRTSTDEKRTGVIPGHRARRAWRSLTGVECLTRAFGLGVKEPAAIRLDARGMSSAGAVDDLQYAIASAVAEDSLTTLDGV